MAHKWQSTPLTSVKQVLHLLMELRGKEWLCRGHSRARNELVPSIDRDSLKNLSRFEKLKLERRSIDLFRSTARYFAGGEEVALQGDVYALLVMRHYGVPTRLLDWSSSPHVAAFFAASSHDDEDGEIWAFDRTLYAIKGRQQWIRWPETTTDGNPDNFRAELTAFKVEEPPDWFVAIFYPRGFTRQSAQQGHYSMTARFGHDHAAAIENLLQDQSKYHRYVFRANLKAELRKILRDEHAVWRGTLFPDSAGAAETAGQLFPSSISKPVGRQ